MTPIQVRALRARLKLTQHELGNLLHTTGHTVSQWECGRHRPHRIFVKRLRELELTYDVAATND